MQLCAIDPGTDESAVVVINIPSFAVTHRSIDNNNNILEQIRERDIEAEHLLIEKVACYGMAVGAEVFQTCFWIGRFMEAWHPKTVELMGRTQVKTILCHTTRAKDKNVTQAVKDFMASHFGIRESELKGRKASPGPLYGIKSHEWQALALAVAWSIHKHPNLGVG